MKTISCMTFVMLVTCGVLSAQLHPDYENPAVFERGQELPHASLMPFATLEKALEGQSKSSSFYLSLNGTWDFHWSENPEKAPADFYKPGARRSDWSSIKVPANWQMEGFGYPLFRNIGLPHPQEPPLVPKEFNPVGSYYRTFDLPDGWKGRQVFLHFEGVHSASYVWVNGREVGYNQGGMEPAEYDITPFLKKGENSVAVKVLRYSDGSYLEDQDTWRLSGIYRDVYLMSTPAVHIRDFYAVPDLNDSYDEAELRVDAWVRNYSHKKALSSQLRFTLFDPQGKEVPGSKTLVSTGELSLGEEVAVQHSMKIENPRLWSAEYPHLYTLTMELIKGSEVWEVLSSRVGLRQVEVINQAICVNGVPIKFNGVNSHMMHPETGHAMDVETIRKDFHLMKQFNINCVRTSHYPPNVEYLDLADELGIYIVDETGDEAHAYTQLSHDPEWKEQYLDRMRKMVYRDRNHPSVVIWSAGNESGSGDNICALIAGGKEIDPSRPAWLYGGNRDEDPKANPIRCEDVVGPRYLQPFRLEQRFGKSDDPRPSYMDEYIAATGNSLGGLDEYWELIYKYPRLTGGAIWDWISQGISMPVISTPDDSPGGLQCVLINRAKLVPGEEGKALYLSGNDDWLEIYRDPSLDITGQELSLSFYVKPEAYNGTASFLTKGDYQFGIVQASEEELEFYLNTGRKSSLKVELPADWEHTWHHVVGSYDGTEMQLFVDGELLGKKAVKGNIVNAPYQVILGKSAELRDGHQGYMCHATLDRVRIFEAVVPVERLAEDDQALKPGSRLWLDFESTEKKGSYYSIGIPGRTYGLIWPDRSVQPELWQLKKSPQPVEFESLALEEGRIRITNRHHFKNLEELDFMWELTVNGVPKERGSMDVSLKPGESGEYTLPISLSDIHPGEVVHLLVSCSTSVDQPWAKAGHEVAWEQFLLADGPRPAEDDTKHPDLLVSADEQGVEVRGEGFIYGFDKQSGVLSSMILNGEEILKKGPVLNVWRAPLANDLDSWNFWHTELGHVTEGMGKETANGWRSIGLDQLEQEVDHFTITELEHALKIHVEASLHARNHTSGFKVFYDYTLYGNGKIELDTRVSARGNMTKWIPKVGIQMELSGEFQGMEWFGRGPFETYPDRKTGAKTGIYRTTVEEAYVPYIIPQDYGNRSDVYWFKLTNEKGTGLYITAPELFHVSAQKFSTGHLDRSHYPFQLKEENLVTLNLDHRITGVGGTANSVLNPYRVAPGEFSFSFTISPLKP